MSAASSVDLPAFGSPTRPDVRDQPELEAELALLARLALLGVRRRLVGGGREVRVAEPAAPAARDHRPPGPTATRSAISAPVSPSITAVPGGTDRYRSSPALPWRFWRSPRPPGVAAEVVLVAEVVERGLAGVDAEVDGAAATAVAAVGSAARDVGLAAHRRRAVAARTGTHGDPDVVEEHRRHCRTGPRGRAGRDRARRSA